MPEISPHFQEIIDLQVFCNGDVRRKVDAFLCQRFEYFADWCFVNNIEIDGALVITLNKNIQGSLVSKNEREWFILF